MQSNCMIHFGNVDLTWTKVWPHLTSIREGVMNWSKLKGKTCTYHFHPQGVEQAIILTSFPTSWLTREIFLILRSVMVTKLGNGFVGPWFPFIFQSNIIFTLIPSTPCRLHENIRQKLPAINATSYHRKVFVNLIDFNKQNRDKH